MTKKADKAGRPGAIDRFIALPDAEKERIWQEIDQQTPEELEARSKPLGPQDRKRWDKFQKRQGSAGRAKLGPRGVKVIALSLERNLLDRADAYAKKLGLKRSQFLTQLLEAELSKAR